jgi:hypothetical protein
MATLMEAVLDPPPPPELLELPPQAVNKMIMLKLIGRAIDLERFSRRKVIE